LSLLTTAPPTCTLVPSTTLFRSEIVVVGTLPLPRPESPAGEAGQEAEIPAATVEGAIARFREGTRPARMQIASEAEYRYRRKVRSEEHTSELQSRENLVCRLLLE